VAGEAPWPFSCEVVVGRFSKLDEQAREEGEELQEELDPDVVQGPGGPVVRVVLPQVARDRHSERDRVSYERGWASERGRRARERDVPVRIELSTWSVLGTQGKQGTQLAVKH
jgi:hypothetical protein